MMILQIATPDGQRDMTPEEQSAFIAQQAIDDAQPKRVPLTPTKEQLFAELQALTAKIQSLE
jgi:hypothetical protein